MRRLLTMFGVALACSTVAGCTVPPQGGPGGPVACGATPIDLGPAQRISDVADDGSTVLVSHYSDDNETVLESVERTSGVRRPISTTAPSHGSVAPHMDGAGRRVLLEHSWIPPEWQTKWFLHDLQLGTTVELLDGLADERGVLRIGAELDRALLQGTPGGGPYRMVDLDTGEVTDLPIVEGRGWYFTEFSPDLSFVVQYSSPPGDVRSVRVLSTATGEVVRDVGPVRSELEWGVDALFVDDETLLVTSAVPHGAPADAIDDDGAFLVDIASGRVTRLDPGVAGARTWSATPDGTRSVFTVIGEHDLWVRIDGVNHYVSELSDFAHDRALRTFFTEDGQRLWQRCF